MSISLAREAVLCFPYSERRAIILSLVIRAFSTIIYGSSIDLMYVSISNVRFFSINVIINQMFNPRKGTPGVMQTSSCNSLSTLSVPTGHSKGDGCGQFNNFVESATLPPITEVCKGGKRGQRIAGTET